MDCVGIRCITATTTVDGVGVSVVGLLCWCVLVLLCRYVVVLLCCCVVVLLCVAVVCVVLFGTLRQSERLVPAFSGLAGHCSPWFTPRVVA